MRIMWAVAIRPRLWFTAFGLVWSHRRANWYRQLPCLPLPAEDYLAFRWETQYGEARRLTSADSDDVLEYVAWVKSWKSRR